MAFHDIVLHLDGEGGWTLHDASTGAQVGGDHTDGSTNRDRAEQSTEVLQGMTQAKKASASTDTAVVPAEGKLLARAIPHDPDDERESRAAAKTLSVPRAMSHLSPWSAVGRFLDMVVGGGAGRKQWGHMVSVWADG